MHEPSKGEIIMIPPLPSLDPIASPSIRKLRFAPRTVMHNLAIAWLKKLKPPTIRFNIPLFLYKEQSQLTTHILLNLCITKPTEPETQISVPTKIKTNYDP